MADKCNETQARDSVKQLPSFYQQRESKKLQLACWNDKK